MTTQPTILVGSVLVSTNTRAPAIGTSAELKTRPETLPLVELETGQPSWLIGGNVVTVWICIEGAVVAGGMTEPTATFDREFIPVAEVFPVSTMTPNNKKPASNRLNRRVKDFTESPIS